MLCRYEYGPLEGEESALPSHLLNAPPLDMYNSASYHGDALGKMRLMHLLPAQGRSGCVLCLCEKKAHYLGVWG